jgi:2-polyprenyl-3-methyl-5-hydroxy-6-metoxy-1,4-benzoquinol methylase
MIKRIITKSLSILGYKISRLNSLSIKDAVTYNSKSGADEFYQSSNRVDNYYSKQRLKAYEEIFSYTDTLGILKNHKILDAGCGPGFFSNFIYQKTKSNNIFGCDFSSVAISLAKKKYPNLSFLESNLEVGLPEKFDFIFCLSVLEHIEYPEITLNQLLKQLNPNGKLIITIPNGRLDSFDGHIHFWSIESWNLFLNKNIENFNWEVHHLKTKPDLLTILSF